MVDIHCHLLPGVDDGPKTMEAALELAWLLVEDGVTHAVATPHVFPGRYANTATNIPFEFARFTQAANAAGIPLTFSCAGEVRLDYVSLQWLRAGELPTLGQCGGYRTMLIELPDSQIPLGTEKFMDALLKDGIRPVIVHPERNRAVMEKPSRIFALVDQGCFVQITAGSVVGQFGARAFETAKVLLSEGWVHAVASDCHNSTARRPRMKDARAWLAQRHGKDFARRLTDLAPAALCGIGKQ